MNPLCIDCKERPALKYNRKDTKKKHGLRCWKCEYARRSPADKDRQLEWQVKHWYGITLEEYRDLKRLQDNQCYICGRIGGDTHYTSLCLDHNHTTGAIRKFLCRRCNVALSFFEDVDYCQKLVAYLEEHK
jgi:hypothetical protein